MERIAINGTVVLDNGQEFYCFQVLDHEDTSYIYLISTTTPIEVRFAKQRMVDGALQVDIINNKEEKLFALKLFQDDYKAKYPAKNDSPEQ